MIARRLGVPAGGASIVEPNALAEFDCNSGMSSLITLLAGAAAEVILLGHYDEIGSTVDGEMVRQRMKYWYGSDDGLQVIWNDALGLVRQHIDVIKVLATYLENNFELDGSMIDKIVG